MTHEEAKKMGATHSLELGRYTDGSGYLFSYYKIFKYKLFVLDCDVWIESEYTASRLNLKPL